MDTSCPAPARTAPEWEWRDWFRVIGDDRVRMDDARPALERVVAAVCSAHGVGDWGEVPLAVRRRLERDVVRAARRRTGCGR